MLAIIAGAASVLTIHVDDPIGVATQLLPGNCVLALVSLLPSAPSSGRGQVQTLALPDEQGQVCLAVVVRADLDAGSRAAHAASGTPNMCHGAAVQEGLLSAVVGGVPQNGGLRRGGPLQFDARRSLGQQGTLALA